jgi:hypothetical protein
MLRCEICHVSCLHSCAIILAVNNDHVMAEGRECQPLVEKCSCMRESVHAAYYTGIPGDKIGMHLAGCTY